MREGEEGCYVSFRWAIDGLKYTGYKTFPIWDCSIFEIIVVVIKHVHVW